MEEGDESQTAREEGIERKIRKEGRRGEGE